MADVSKVTASDGTTYDIKDATARSGLSDKMDKANPTGTGALSINRKSGTTTGSNSVALGENCTASGSDSFASGYQCQATGSYAHATGYQAKATAGKAHAEGTSTTASGTQSHAEGGNTYAYGNNSHAEGYYTYAGASSNSKHYSHAEGTYTQATGEASHAEGFGASNRHVVSSGTGSHAEGECTTASGFASHAEGGETVASGSSSHAEGVYTTASGSHSHAEGQSTIASGEDQHVSGKYNIADSNGTYAEIIGNGTADNDRSNARTLDWGGNEVISGGFQCNAMNVSSSSVTLINPQKWRDAIFDCTPDSSAKDRLLSRLTKSGANIQILEYGGYFSGSQNKRLKMTMPNVAYGKYLIFVHLEADVTVHDYEIFAVENADGTAFSRAHYGRTTPSWTNMTGTAATGTLTWGVTGTQIYSSIFASYGSWYVKMIISDGPNDILPNVYFTNES